MLEIQQEIVTSLRDMANRGMTPSQILRGVLQRYSLEEPRQLVLSLYCHYAFGLEAYQTGPIFNWDVFATGNFSDAQLDFFLGRHLKNADWPGKAAAPNHTANCAQPQAAELEK
jgi:hypothetical protein